MVGFSCLVDVLGVVLVVHAEPGAQTATGSVNPEVSGRICRRTMGSSGPKDHSVEMAAIMLNSLALNQIVREDEPSRE